MMTPNHHDALDQMFLSARSHSIWTDRPVEDEILRKLYDVVAMGPTSTNCCPARFSFLRGDSKERLIPSVFEGNIAKVQAAPVTVLVSYDREFFHMLPKLFVHRPEIAETYVNDQDHADYTAFQNATLQVAYLIIVARALGLDCGPMTGFDRHKLDAEFFPDGRYKSNVLINLGYGDPDALFPRLPRPSFDEVCDILS